VFNDGQTHRVEVILGLKPHWVFGRARSTGGAAYWPEHIRHRSPDRL